MAYIYKRGKTWTADVSLLMNGKRKHKTKSGFSTKVSAQRWANETEVEKQNNDLILDSGQTFPDFFGEWYTTFKKNTVGLDAQRWYVYILKTLRENFPNTKLETITRVHWQRFLNKYALTHSVSTVKKFNTRVRQMVRDAVADGYIQKDFTYGAKFSGKPVKDDDLKFLEQTDMGNLIASVNSKPISERSMSDMMILAALQTGARYAELAGITWDSIDNESNIISITKSWDQVTKVFKGTKTKNSIRDIEVTEPFIRQLEDLHVIYPRSQFVFGGNSEFPPTSNAVNKQLRRDLSGINAEKVITFHGLRHTHASWLISKGVDIQYVSERLGHANIEITLSTYTHLLKEKREDEIKRSISLLSQM